MKERGYLPGQVIIRLDGLAKIRVISVYVFHGAYGLEHRVLYKASDGITNTCIFSTLKDWGTHES